MERGKTLEILTSVQRYVQSELDALIDDYCAEAESQLILSAQWSSSGSLRSIAFETIGLLRQKRAELCSGMLERISVLPNRYQEVAPPQTDSIPKSSAELELLDLQMLDAELALKSLIQHGNQRWSQQIYGLEQRFSHLLHTESDAGTFAMSMSAVGHALYDGLVKSGVELEVLPQLLAIAESTWLPRLGDIYDEINERLKRAGVLPALEINQWPELQRFRQSSQDPEPALEQATSAEAEREDVQQVLPPENYGAARKLLRFLRQSMGVSSSSAAASVSPVDPAIVLNALAAVAGSDESPSLQLPFPHLPLLQRINSWLVGQGITGTIADESADQLAFSEQVVTELAALLQDAPQLVALVEKLQIPLAGAALTTPNLFEQADHPATQLINTVGRLCETGDIKHAAFGQKIQEVLDPLTAVNGIQTAAFDVATSELERLSEQQLKSRDRSIQRLVETCEGQQKLSQAQLAVDRELHRRLAHITLPQLLVDLVQGGWRELLRLTFLRSGEFSAEWRDALNLLDELLWTFNRALQTPDQERRTDPVWMQSAEVLCSSIKRRFDAYFPLDYLHATLVDSIRAALQGVSEIALAAAPFELPTRRLRSHGVLHAELEQAYPDLIRWFRRAREFKVGDVFSHFNDTARKMHTLVWIGAEQQHFVLVNSRGSKSFDFDLVDLARALAGGLYPVEAAAHWTLVERAVLNSAQAAYEQIAFNSSHDVLTGLLNRREFEVCLDAALLDAKARQNSQALLYLDVDQFALINELHGHLAGDAVLQEVGQRLLSVGGSTEVSARMAGNEFAILLNADKDGAITIAEKLRENIAGIPFNLGADTIELTVSIGIVEINKYTDNSNNLLRDASYATQLAKKAGRNRVSLFDGDIETQARRDKLLAWINKLNAVMESDTLVLRAQAIVPVENPAAVKHYEVLLGLRGENGSILPPSDFIEAAECYNRMQRVDRWIVEHAFIWLRQILDLGKPAPTLSINLSANSLNDSTFLDFLIEQFGTHRIPPTSICFEVTETATIDNLANAVDFMRQAKKLGCSFALDDFGTGRSSYEYLKQMPVDYLKIDGAFIVNIDRDSNDLLMVKSIAEIAHGMGIKTIAEYVERNEILTTLSEIGVDFAQGYFIGKPCLLTAL